MTERQALYKQNRNTPFRLKICAPLDLMLTEQKRSPSLLRPKQYLLFEINRIRKWFPIPLPLPAPLFFDRLIWGLSSVRDCCCFSFRRLQSGDDHRLFLKTCGHQLWIHSSCDPIQCQHINGAVHHFRDPVSISRLWSGPLCFNIYFLILFF